MSNTSSKAELKRLREVLEKKVETLAEEHADAERSLRAVETTLQLLKSGFDTEEQPDRYARSFGDITQLEALEKIARENGNNRFRVSEARRIMIAAQMIKTPRNANSILYTLIKRSDRFRRIGPGEYELLPEKPKIVQAMNG